MARSVGVKEGTGEVDEVEGRTGWVRKGDGGVKEGDVQTDRMGETNSRNSGQED